MRFLILSCNTGEGHNTAAKAIEEILREEDIFFRRDDALVYLSPKVSKFICDWHVRLYNKAPRLYHAGYRVAERHDPETETTPKALALLKIGAAKLKVALEHGQYDAVICTHIFAGLMMTRVRQEFGVPIPYYFVATDYTCSPFVAESQADMFFIPHEDLVEEFALCGTPKSRLLPTGIPVSQQFFMQRDRSGSRKALNLPAEEPVVLLMGGSMGAGPISKLAVLLAKELPENAHLTIICGKNERLLEELTPLTGHPKVTLVGFTTQIHLYMDSASLILTKPGGLSTTEAAVKRLPMVLIDAVGGCEARNLDFFLQNGLAWTEDSVEALSRLVCALVTAPKALEAMRTKLDKGFQHNGASEICRYLLPRHGK